MRNGGWQTALGFELEGKTLGVIGLGRLGSQVAEIAKAFRMDVVAWSPNLTAERAAECGARLATKQDLLASADIVTIHVRLGEATRSLISRREFAIMKPTALLINTSRGPVVEEAALIEALHSGAIGGAGLDVFDVEPLPPGHPLRSAPNTVITPHLGFVTIENYRVFFGAAVENIRAWLDGRPINTLG